MENASDPSPAAARKDLPEEMVRRWTSEETFFNRLADQLRPGLKPVSPALRRRYLEAPRRIYDKEFRFQLLGDLAGKRVLDLGCGEGSNSVLLALAGAEVEAIDLSAGLIELAKQRAEANGVQSRVRFQCAPIELANLPEQSIDVIWGDGILHHVIDVLEPTLQQLLRWARPGARFVFSEPVRLMPAVDWIRQNLPIHTEATPDERPLGPEQIDLLRAYLPGLQMRHFMLMGWLTRFLIPNGGYEEAPRWRQSAADLLQTADYLALSLERLAPLGGMAVLWGQTPEGIHPLQPKD